MIGKKIREFRKNKNMSISEFASKVGISDSYISQLERGVIDPSVSVLRKIANTLNVPIASFFDEDFEEPAVIRQDEYSPHPYTSDAMSLEQLSPTSEHWENHLESQMFHLPVKKEAQRLKHSGETCIHVLKGTVEINVDETTYLLKKGDSIYIHAHIPYQLSNAGASVASGIICSTGAFEKEVDV